MIQAARIYLYPGVTANVYLAQRSPTIQSWITYDDPGDSESGSYSYDAMLMVDPQNAFSTPPTPIAPTAPATNFTAQFIPWFNPTLGKWTLGYVNYSESGTVVPELTNYADDLFFTPYVISQQLDPSSEPVFGEATAVSAGSVNFDETTLIGLSNLKSARVVITGTPAGFGTFWNTSDSGKFGWICAGHGAPDTEDLTTLDWDQVQFLNFTNNRIQFNAGT